MGRQQGGRAHAQLGRWRRAQRDAIIIFYTAASFCSSLQLETLFLADDMSGQEVGGVVTSAQPISWEKARAHTLSLCCV
jgi:hypothetical protein